MKEDSSQFFTLAKYINQEMLLQELFRAKEFAFVKYSKKKKKVKVIITKIFYSLIFGILPVVPLMAYFKMKDELITDGLPISMVVFAGSLLFVFFFALEFLNIFFMGMIEVSLILSNPLFKWIKSLPLSDKTLTRLKLYSVFRSFDLPIIVIIFTFPIVMLVGTQNFLLFLIFLGISICHVILSLSALVLFGERMNRVLSVNKLNSRKTMVIRLVNTFGYIIILFGSLVFVQWATSSIEVFFRFSMVQRYPEIINLILSTFPFPFSSSYLISFITITGQVHFHYWISIICGYGLFIIFTYWISRTAVQGLKRLTSKEEDLNKYVKTKNLEEKLQIKIRKPVFAHFFKDLAITTRSLKVFLSVITPIIISFVFTFTFNFTVLKSATPLDSDFFYNFYVILAFQPVISGMLIYNLINIEGSGDPILSTLPIIPKNQAKSKLLYFTIIQTISVIAPYLIYIFRPGFIDLLITISISLLFTYIILFSMFEMFVYFFGRMKYRFVLDQVNIENKTMKWAFIYITEYIFYFLITSISFLLYLVGTEFLIFNFSLFLVFCYGMLLLSFKIMFSSELKPKGRIKPKVKPIKLSHFSLRNYKIRKQKDFNLNFLFNYPWLSITVLLFIDIFLESLCILYSAILSEIFHISSFYVLFWFSFFPTILVFYIWKNYIPRIDKNSIKVIYSSYSDNLKKGIFGTIFIVSLHTIFAFSLSIPFPFENANILDVDVFLFLGILIYALWHEILLRGIFFPLLLSKYDKPIAFYLNTFISFIYYIIYFSIYFVILNLSVLFLLENLLYIFIINLILTYLFTLGNNVYPALIVHLITTFVGILPYFYFGMYIFI